MHVLFSFHLEISFSHHVLLVLHIFIVGIDLVTSDGMLHHGVA